MTVSIDVDLDAGSAYAELAELETLLKSMGSDLDSVDFDLGDFDVDDLADGIDDLVDSLEKAERRMGNIKSEIRDSAEILDDLDGTDINFKNKDGGDSDRGGTRQLTVDYDGSNLPGGSRATGDGGRSGSDVDFRNAMRGIFGSGRTVKMTDSDLVGLNYDTKSRYVNGIDNPQRNLGLSAVRGDYSDPMSRIGRDTGAGMEPASMRDRRGGVSFEQFDGTGRGTSRWSSYPDPTFKEILRGKKDDFVAETNYGRMTKGLDTFESKLQRLKPTVGKFYTLLGLLSPVLIAAGVQAAGVAAAMGSVAVAGAAVVGLGLIGHADSMAGSFAQAKQEVQDFKVALFEAFQPAAQSYAPISERFLDYAPNQLGDMVREMRGLRGYEDTLFAVFDMGVGGLEEFFSILNRNEGIISQMTTRFAGMLGGGLLDMFEWLMQSASQNQNLLVTLGNALMRVGVILYNLSMAVGRVAGTLMPFLNVLTFASKLLNTTFAQGLLVAIAYSYILGKVLTSTVVQGLYKATMFIWGYTASTKAAVFWTLTLVTAVAALTAGLSLIGAGIGSMTIGDFGQPFGGGNMPTPGAQGAGTGTPRGGQGAQQVTNNYTTYTVNYEGSLDNGGEQRLRSTLSEDPTATPTATESESSSATYNGRTK